MDELTQPKEARGEFKKFLIVNLACIVIVIIIATIKNVDWGSILAVTPPTASPPIKETQAITGDMQGVAKSMLHIASFVFSLIVAIVAMLSVLRITLDILYISTPMFRTFFKSERAEKSLSDSEPIIRYLKDCAPGMFITSIIMFALMFLLWNGGLEKIIDMMASLMGG